MKKIILSSAVVILFAVYAFLVKSGSFSMQLYKPSPIPVASEPTSTATVTDPNKVIKKSDCVYIPYKDDEESESSEDNENEEIETKNGYYKCTTITVSTPPTTTTSPSANTTVSTSTPVTITPPPVTKPKSLAIWKDGTFIGDAVDAYYGLVQISATISDGSLTSISFLDYPQDRRTSLEKSIKAMPILKSEAISSQSANVNSVSGVTYTSEAFIGSLASALAQAKI